MNTTARRIVLLLTVLLAAYVGGWAAFLPERFYDSFPGLGLTWVSTDGPYNEHLVRDVGGLYLGLGAASLAAAFSRGATAGRVVGLGWAVFGLLHLAYHVGHLPAAPIDAVGNVVTLGLSLVLGLVLTLPARPAPVPVPPAAEVTR